MDLLWTWLPVLLILLIVRRAIKDIQDKKHVARILEGIEKNKKADQKGDPDDRT